MVSARLFGDTNRGMSDQPHIVETAGGPEPEPRLQGPFRQHLWLIVAVLVVLVVGPTISRVLSSYEGIILEVSGERVLVGFENVPPEWQDGVQAAPGDILAKSAWSWSPEVIPAQAVHRTLRDLFERYAQTYSATVVEIMPPDEGVSSALIRMDDKGDEIIIKIYSEHLAGLAEGDRIEKKIHSWEPVIVTSANSNPPAQGVAKPDGN